MLQPHQERLLSQITDLEKELEQLQSFLTSPEFHALEDCDEQDLLIYQQQPMKAYLKVLRLRAGKFQKTAV